MKLMDKIKNLFLDEEEYEVDDEEEFPQHEVKDKKELKKPLRDELPKVMRDNIKKEEKVELKIKPEDFVKNEEKTVENNKKFNFPIDLNDDFPSRSNKIILDEVSNKEKENHVSHGNNVNVLKIDKQVTQKVTDLYSHRDEEKVKPKFKASPVISPVYGVLDKNYTKEEVKEKSEEMVEMKRPSKKVDFETVRKKAFGNLTDEIKDNMLCENCELYKEVKRISTLKEDDLLYDMTVDDSKETTIEKAYDNYEEFGVVYEPKVEKNTVSTDDIDDVVYGNQDEIGEFTDNANQTEVIDDKLLVDKVDIENEKNDNDEVIINKEGEEIPSREEKKKETKVDEDFFKLIDSMYKERVDE